MKYVGDIGRASAMLFFALSLISCQKQLDLESGLPMASGIYVSESTGFTGVVMVSIPGGGICTGTIVSHKAVLTAAHCTNKAGTYMVRGNFSSKEAGQEVKSRATSIKVNFGPGVVNDPNDISFLIFPDGSFEDSDIVPIANSSRSGSEATLVGYGCNNLDTRTGAGKKRAGNNIIAAISAYVEFYTPASMGSARGIIGPSNRAGSCFGDSGGPALVKVQEKYELIAVTHAGGVIGQTIVSQYTDVANRSDNRSFISDVNRDYQLGIAGF